MITEGTATEVEPESTFTETTKIMDEMDRLLDEMKETMITIKKILGEEAEGATTFSPGLDNVPLSAFREVIHSS